MELVESKFVFFFRPVRGGENFAAATTRRQAEIPESQKRMTLTTPQMQG